MHGLVKIQISAPPTAARNRASGDGFLSLPAGVSSEVPPERGKQEAATQAGSRRFLLSVPFEGEKNDSENDTSGRKVHCSSSGLAPAADARLKERRTVHNVEQLGPGCQCFWNSASSKWADINYRSTLQLERVFGNGGFAHKVPFRRWRLFGLLGIGRRLKSQKGGGEMCAPRRARRLPQRISGRFVEPGTVAAETLSG